MLGRNWSSPSELSVFMAAHSFVCPCCLLLISRALSGHGGQDEDLLWGQDEDLLWGHCKAPVSCKWRKKHTLEHTAQFNYLNKNMEFYHHLLKMPSFSHCALSAALLKISWLYACIEFWALYFISPICMGAPMLGPCCLNFCIFFSHRFQSHKCVLFNAILFQHYYDYLRHKNSKKVGLSFLFLHRWLLPVW